MADELSFTFNMQFEKGNAAPPAVNSGTQSVTVSGTYYIHNIQNIATSAENIEKGAITTPGYCWFHNMDGTNYVEIGYDDSGFKPLVKLLKGEWAGPFRLTQATPQAQANTGAVDLEYFMVEA